MSTNGLCPEAQITWTSRVSLAVKTPLAFFQEPIKTAFGDAIEAPQMALHLIPEVLDAVDVMASFADEIG